MLYVKRYHIDQDALVLSAMWAQLVQPAFQTMNVLKRKEDLQL